MSGLEAGAIVPRATVAQICAHRRVALELFNEAHQAVEIAAQAILRAREAASAASPGTNRFNNHLDDDCAPFLSPLKVPTLAAYQASARTMIDTNVWAHVIGITDLDSLMDKKAKDELYQALLADPPEATEENIFATLQQFAADSGMIFRRGIAECFSNLDRRFKSHDGWKIGSRIILSYAFHTFGWSHHRSQRDTIIDVERAFHVLDGKPPPSAAYGGIIGAIEESRRTGYGPRQSECETEYFLVRGYKNGNAHMWFKRDDLVAKVNQLLGEYYDAPIPHERGPDDTEDIFRPKMTPAKNYGFFPTPDAAADFLFDLMPYWPKDEPTTVLEPSAGTGQLAKRARAKGAAVDCVEVQPDLAAGLAASGLYDAVFNRDFLTLQPAAIYDRVIMNPPFDLERDIDHVIHALKFLKPGGHLTAIMSAGTEFRETRKSKAFRELMESMGANWRDMPKGSFASVGTNCNTIALTVRKR